MEEKMTNNKHKNSENKTQHNKYINYNNKKLTHKITTKTTTRINLNKSLVGFNLGELIISELINLLIIKYIYRKKI